jgi:hypothetical protein
MDPAGDGRREPVIAATIGRTLSSINAADDGDGLRHEPVVQRAAAHRSARELSRPRPQLSGPDSAPGSAPTGGGT